MKVVMESLVEYKMLAHPLCPFSFKTDLEGKCGCPYFLGGQLRLRKFK